MATATLDPATTVIDDPEPAQEVEKEVEKEVAEVEEEVVEEVEDDDDDVDDEKFDKARAIAKINKTNAEARNLRKEVKRLKDIEAKVKADDDAKKSDLDKAIARAEAAEQKLKEADLKVAHAAVKERFDLPARVLAKLEGDTIEELIESATEWAADLGIEDKTKPAKKGRKTATAADLDGGLKPNDTAPTGRTVKSVVDGLRLDR